MRLWCGKCKSIHGPSCCGGLLGSLAGSIYCRILLAVPKTLAPMRSRATPWHEYQEIGGPSGPSETLTLDLRSLPSLRKKLIETLPDQRSPLLEEGLVALDSEKRRFRGNALLHSHSQRLVEDSIEETASSGLGCGELRFQSVAHRHQFIHLRDDAVLFGERWEGNLDPFKI